MWKPITLGLAIALAGGMSLTTAVSAEGHGDRGDRGPAPFEMADSDGDGALTLAELQAAAAARFAETDANSDGAISAEEMLAARDRDSGRAERRAKRMIERRDANDDGLLQFSEMYDAERAGERFAKADANSDGKLTKDEAGKMRGGRHGPDGGRHKG